MAKLFVDVKLPSHFLGIIKLQQTTVFNEVTAFNEVALIGVLLVTACLQALFSSEASLSEAQS